jgi:hypothetical protein
MSKSPVADRFVVPAINMLRGRSQLPPTRTFVLPEVVGWIINLLGVAFVIVTTM